MDSLTQCVLGACVGGLCAPDGRRRRGACYGMVFGTLPDLDVLLPAADPVTAMVTHRGFSHSLLVLSLVAPLCWWLLATVDRVWQLARARWLMLTWLSLVTHPLLDWCTVYGTQLLWPFDRTPYALGNVFVIDPVYTLPLLAATLVLMIAPDPGRQRRWAGIALLLSTFYLCWGLLAQQLVTHRARAALVALDLPADTPLHVAPGPLSTLLWRVLARTPDGHWYEAWSALSADAAAPLRGWVRHAGLPASAELRSGLPQLARLAAFSQGWFALREIDNVLWYGDLRMGAHPWLAFRFALARRDETGRWQALDPPRQAPFARPPLRILGWIGARIVWDSAAVYPEGRDDRAPWAD